MTVEAISHTSHILVMAWTIDNVSKLIEEIEVRPIIWNVFLDEYKDRSKKSAAWREVGQALNEELSEVSEKMEMVFIQSCLNM